MAVLTPGSFTYAEWALRMDPDGKTSFLVNLLSQNNGMLEDQLATECQNGTTYVFTQVVQLPPPTRRVFNQGVVANMAAVAKQTVSTSEYSGWAVFDAALARLGGNVADLRGQEAAMHMEGMGQQVASDLFYAARTTDPTQFTGFANIYSTVTTSTSQIAKNVIDCGGTGSNNASMWLVGWGPRAIHTIFPKGIPAGLQHRDYGDAIPLVDSSSNSFPGYRDWFQWDLGLAIEDWRYCVRAANIDVTLFGSGTQANLINILTAMVYKPPIMPAGVGPIQTSDSPDKIMMARFCFYVNRTVFQALDLQAQNKTNILLKMEEWDGHVILSFRGIPIRCADALLINETQVT